MGFALLARQRCQAHWKLSKFVEAEGCGVVGALVLAVLSYFWGFGVAEQDAGVDSGVLRARDTTARGTDW